MNHTLILSLFLSTFAYSQGRLIEKYPSIQREVEAIDQLDSVSTLTLMDAELCRQWSATHGVIQSVYREDGTIAKLEVTTFEAYGVQVFHFYLQNELPIYVVDRYYRFSDPNQSSADPPRFDGGFHGTYLFVNGSLIDRISLGHNRFENEENDAEELFLKECGQYLEAVKKEQAFTLHFKPLYYPDLTMMITFERPLPSEDREQFKERFRTALNVEDRMYYAFIENDYLQTNQVGVYFDFQTLPYDAFYFRQLFAQLVQLEAEFKIDEVRVQ